MNVLEMLGEIAREAEDETIYVPGCAGNCDGPTCHCVENLQRIINANPGKKVVFLPNTHAVFQKKG